jgi:hypothetical protein
MNAKRATWVLCLVVWSVAAPASAQNFFNSYLKPEYLVPVGDFPSTSGGDRNVNYYQIQIPALANGELLLLGEFPRARYFSITAYDDHGAVLGELNDKDIVPYGSSANPFAVGGPAGAEDILYAVSVQLGKAASSPLSQCATPLDVHRNVLDASNRHTAGTFYSSQQSGFSANVAGYGSVVHDDTLANTGAFLLIRTYLRQPPTAASQFDLRKPLVWVRQASTGCAAQIAPAGQSLPISQWFSLSSVLHLDQVYAHQQHEVDLGVSDPYGPDPLGESPWFGREEYLPGQAVGRYLSTVPPIDATSFGTTAAALNAQGRVLEMQFRLPQLPCHTSPSCGFTGTEQLRYWSVTFEDATGVSLGTMSELSLAPDPNGYVTLVVSFGTPLPAAVNAANGYSVITTPVMPFYRLVMRNYLPAATFFCSTNNVPFRTAEYNPNGGYMGEYAPVISMPIAAGLPQTAQPLVQADSCQFP